LAQFLEAVLRHRAKIYHGHTNSRTTKSIMPAEAIKRALSDESAFRHVIDSCQAGERYERTKKAGNTRTMRVS